MDRVCHNAVVLSEFNIGMSNVVPMDAKESMDELALGLDWAQWLLRSVRQRCAGILLPEQTDRKTAMREWEHLACVRFQLGLGRCLADAMSAAADRNVAALARFEVAWGKLLTAEEAERSAEAGHWLLGCMKGAHHVGILHRVQELVQQKGLNGHIGVVWPVVACVFQIPTAAMLCEYLRLEYQCSVRCLPDAMHDASRSNLFRAVKSVLPNWPSIVSEIAV
jgi:hypothetical protein